jgi:translation initiation factor 1A|tara:strand:+ start:2075 stop:2497 length:423 start_codon:yes stop_codon:yes gene_type:complete
MPKNKKKNFKKREPKARVIEFAEDQQLYCKVIKMLGNRRVTVLTVDNKEVLARIPGRFRRRVKVLINDLVLVSTREYQDDKVDIIHKYLDEEARLLVSYKEIPSSFIAKDSSNDVDEQDNIFFGFSDSDSEDENIDIDNL